MKKLSDFIISYVTEASLGTGGSFYYMPATGGASAPTSSPAPATSYSPSVVSNNPDYDFQSRLGGMVKAKTKESEELLNRMRRVAGRQEAAGGVDPGVASKIAELEDQLSPAGQSRIREEESKKLESGIERVETRKQFSNLPSGMFKTTPKTEAEQEAYNAAKDAMTLLMKRDEDKKTGAAGFSDDSAVESAFQISREKSAAVDAERKSASKISPVYQITQGDFKTATGQDYDPRNPQNRQLFFDLASRGAPTSSATAGPGESPGFNTPQFYTMRGRPQNIPQFGTPEAWYDKETGQLARTTEQSRTRTAEKQAIEKSNKEFDEREKKLNAVTDFVVNFNYPNQSQQVSTVKPTPKPTSKQTLSPQDNFSFNVERGARFY